MRTIPLVTVTAGSVITPTATTTFNDILVETPNPAKGKWSTASSLITEQTPKREDGVHAQGRYDKKTATTTLADALGSARVVRNYSLDHTEGRQTVTDVGTQTSMRFWDTTVQQKRREEERTDLELVRTRDDQMLRSLGHEYFTETTVLRRRGDPLPLLSPDINVSIRIYVDQSGLLVSVIDDNRVIMDDSWRLVATALVFSITAQTDQGTSVKIERYSGVNLEMESREGQMTDSGILFPHEGIFVLPSDFFHGTIEITDHETGTVASMESPLNHGSPFERLVNDMLLASLLHGWV